MSMLGWLFEGTLSGVEVCLTDLLKILHLQLQDFISVEEAFRIIIWYNNYTLDFFLYFFFTFSCPSSFAAASCYLLYIPLVEPSKGELCRRYFTQLAELVFTQLDYRMPMISIHCFQSVCASYIDESVLWLQYFGGTNFGRTSGGPFYITSYDYDAPLDEYGG